MGTKKEYTEEELNQAKSKFMKDMAALTGMGPDMKKMYDQVLKMKDDIFAIVKEKECFINGKKAIKRMLKDGTINVKFEDKEESNKFFEE